MNPFDYTGPSFLLFYVALTIVVLIGTRRIRRAMDGEDISASGSRTAPAHEARRRSGGCGEAAEEAD